MKVLAAANSITIEGFLQHNRKQSKKTAQTWRVSGGLFAYAHEREKQPGRKTQTETKP